MIERFKELSDGTLGLAFSMSFVVALIFQYLMEPDYFLRIDILGFWALVVLGWLGYWGSLNIILRIIDGFKKD